MDNTQLQSSSPQKKPDSGAGADADADAVVDPNATESGPTTEDECTPARVTVQPETEASALAVRAGKSASSPAGTIIASPEASTPKAVQSELSHDSTDTSVKHEPKDDHKDSATDGIKSRDEQMPTPTTHTATPTPYEAVNKAFHGGAPLRRYLNDNVTPTLLSGMRMIAREQPTNPLEVLGNYLIEQSKLVAKRETK
ncbi:Dpy-30 motif-domain-containing protein [Limtongia smithiae]|uniref:Dpy-30 motif-domain-containing protein n=1 Tax=Limtongia smithiae TaxID=1125753 RepID=UPI0034CF82B2